MVSLSASAHNKTEVSGAVGKGGGEAGRKRGSNGK